jgi:hypothetical protein
MKSYLTVLSLHRTREIRLPVVWWADGYDRTTY